MSTSEILVEGWPAPKGFANGRVGEGKILHVAGQIGMDAKGEMALPYALRPGVDPASRRPSAVDDPEFVPQFEQALDNVLAIVRAAGGQPTDIAEMTVFVTTMKTYRGVRKELGDLWRSRFGKHYPAMALIGVSELFEPTALVEIQAVAYIGGS